MSEPLLTFNQKLHILFNQYKLKDCDFDYTNDLKTAMEELQRFRDSGWKIDMISHIDPSNFGYTELCATHVTRLNLATGNGDICYHAAKMTPRVLWTFLASIKNTQNAMSNEEAIKKYGADNCGPKKPIVESI